MERNDRNLFQAAFILGLGLLGAVDGIVFHQLLQWHHMVDHHNQIHMKIFSDGWFTILFSLLLVWGGVKIYRDAAKGELGTRPRTFLSGILIGGGVFNLVEGMINHHILQIHRVRPAAENPLLYDISFLIVGFLLVIIGLIVRRKKV
ncbi:DUF2243 domain-containing protein [Salirhabdus salicampi]|uniref:DUF2243 domain-containing protein n=1 Tax=Salirhabdus salicampi TaxID=476102 RepID=UPI0020C2CB61|nr:DUF2243 domain-containing protein [Salirhabdus salicampi]MCP8616195.1 DUF2243 domain-containing protein [Salirhabdus salicampi]